MKKNINDIYPQKRVAITGAGSGLGRQLALDFAKLGWRIALCDINEEKCDETMSIIKGLGASGFSMKCDVSKWKEVCFFAKKTVDEFGGIDIMINNAGVIVAGYVEDVSIEDWHWILSINLMGVVHGCKAFIPILKRNKKGHIINIASSAGFVNLPEMAQYNVAKAGVISLSETLKTELSPYNINVTCVCPTFFKTNLMDSAKWGCERQRELACKFFDKSLCTVEDVSNDIIKGIEKNKMYIITQIDGKFAWYLKKFSPSFFYKILSWLYKRGILESFLKK